MIDTNNIFVTIKYHLNENYTRKNKKHKIYKFMTIPTRTNFYQAQNI